METTPIVITDTFDAPVDKVWQAITDSRIMPEWYFQVTDFKPEVGFETQVDVVSGDKHYPHLWKVTEVIPGKKISYSGKYAGYPGSSEVTFALAAVNGKTQLTLTHKGIETFPQDTPEFRREGFMSGWDMIIRKQLKEFLEKPR